MRKFADKEQAIKQVNGSNTEATLILCGYSGERANNYSNTIINNITTMYVNPLHVPPSAVLPPSSLTPSSASQ